MRLPGSGSWLELSTFVVTNRSSRAMPDASSAAPTSASLPYI